MPYETYDNGWQEKWRAELEKYPLGLPVPDPFLDRIAQQMLEICNTTTVLISFFGSPDTLVKAWAGETFAPGAKLIFCDLVFHRGAYVEVEDTLQHPLYKHNPAVLGRPMIRFFSSTPFISPNGFVLGSLCALNKKPTQFTQEQRLEIGKLSAQVMDYLEGRKSP
jgi:GAF domain-containing protein